MANLTPKWDTLHHEVELWLRKWDGDLDRVERFATTFGETYTRRLDLGFIAMGSALGAMFILLTG